MSLEQHIQELTAAIQALRVSIELKGDAVTPTPAATKKEKRAPKEDTTPVAAMFNEPTPVPPIEMQFAEAQTRLAQVAQRLGSPAKVIEVMGRYNGPPLTQILSEHYAELVAKAEALQ